MPEPQTPSAAAMEAWRAVRDSCKHAFPTPPCEMCGAATLDAYAAERVAETHANVRGAVAALAGERDAAIAKLEAAEAQIAMLEVAMDTMQVSCVAIASTIRSGRVPEVTPAIAAAWANELERVAQAGRLPIGTPTLAKAAADEGGKE